MRKFKIIQIGNYYSVMDDNFILIPDLWGRTMFDLDEASKCLTACVECELFNIYAESKYKKVDVEAALAQLIKALTMLK